MYLHWHQLIENSSRWFVTMWESLLMFIENDCLLMFIVIVKSYNLRNEDQWNNYLQIIWDYVLFHSPICKYERNGAKKKWALFKREIQKVDFVRWKKKTKVWLNTALNTSKMQNILPKIKT